MVVVSLLAIAAATQRSAEFPEWLILRTPDDMVRVRTEGVRSLAWQRGLIEHLWCVDKTWTLWMPLVPIVQLQGHLLR